MTSSASLPITFPHPLHPPQPSFILPKASPALCPDLTISPSLSTRQFYNSSSDSHKGAWVFPALNSTKTAHTGPQPPCCHSPLPPGWSFPGVLAIACVPIVPTSFSRVWSLPQRHIHVSDRFPAINTWKSHSTSFTPKVIIPVPLIMLFLHRVHSATGLTVVSYKEYASMTKPSPLTIGNTLSDLAMKVTKDRKRNNSTILQSH